jgi:hypothetical protein
MRRFIAACASETPHPRDIRRAIWPGRIGKGMACCAIGEAQANAGNVAEAEATASQISREVFRSRVYRAIVTAKAKAGDVAGAIDSAARSTSTPTERCKLLVDVAEDLNSTCDGRTVAWKKQG